jgi:TRAP transporter TAXI family solute receptor
VKKLLIGPLVVLLLAGWFGPALAQDVGIITGSEKGTYYRFGLDLQKLLKPSGLNVTVHPSRGSVDNIYAVYQRPGVQLGVVQADVLAFITRVQSNPLLMQIAKKTRLVFPLYNEEIHLVGKRGIRDFDDLAGKRVAIGRDGSGTYLTSRILFKLSEVQAEFVLIDTAEALAELKAGRIDAMLYVAGAPVGLFKDDVTEADGLSLIPITNKSIGEFYPQVEIPAKTYTWQADTVNTVAVKAVLISYDFRRKDCDTVGRVAQITNTQIETLRKTGHAKWKVVDLDAQVKGWEQYDCVRKYLGRATPAAAAKRRTSDNPVLDAIKQMLDD